MSIRLPLVSKGITLQELPGRTAVYFELGNCNRGCKGCHSPHLSERIHPDLFTDISDMVEYIEKEKTRGADAILLMGGTTNRIDYETLARAIDILSNVLPVGIYSGAAVNSQATRFLKELPGLYWIKAGEFNKKLGGLDSPKTNQRFFRWDGKWEDATHLFQTSS